MGMECCAVLHRFLEMNHVTRLYSSSPCFSLPLCVGLVYPSVMQIPGLIHNKELALKMAEESANANGSSRFERKISMNQLSNIERYTVYKGRVVG
jgi:hypothetical protein